MARLQYVTIAELEKLNSVGEDVCMDLHGLNQRIEKGYCDEIESPVKLARSFLSLSRAAANLAANILTKASLQEMKRETEAAIKALQDAKSPLPDNGKDGGK